MTTRLIVGMTAAVLIAAVAYRRELLDRRGALAATVAGTMSVAAGYRWGVLLVAYFVVAALISRWRQREKSRRTSLVIEKRGARDAWQVFANGGVFVGCAIASSMYGSDVATAAALGAIATAMADTAATEIGSAIGGEPRSIISGQKVPLGVSGGVTVVGSLSMLIGSVVIGTIALELGFGWSTVVAGSAGGIAGGLADSLLGALVQERRVCPACGAATERRVHPCTSESVPTLLAGGVSRFGNDGVNLTSTAIGALVAGVLSRGGI
ncbi:MAG: DUF92 domain-containing protein [Gemmatimonadota bacterium]